MREFLSIDDLRLVREVARRGSVGAAAARLGVSQPTASQRLAALERRSGLRLFQRDTTGARPTLAGRELADQADRILGSIDSLPELMRATEGRSSRTIGTVASLAAVLYPALELLLPELAVHQVTDHGPALVDAVADGSMDAAFIGVPMQTALPAGLSVTVFHRDDLSILRPADAASLGTGRQPYAGRTVFAYTYDPALHESLSTIAALGGRPRRAATAETAVTLARVRGELALLPASLAHRNLRGLDEVLPAPRRRRVQLAMVTRRPGPQALVEVLPELGEVLKHPHLPDPPTAAVPV
ncbi:LysR family transcriptional regulator [Occultella glacieicola]|uniref:LysR family transcriptional regulator n=1 Tax=Occultella glacieicola TaxID=2518684 RepID=A0ABY2DY04_9MICO|nr:LysR family transcriptional regulator [Occultella glacieicola]TDE88558.1 LysR family transcriptional regulator [Occultella glacieicola]